MANRRSNAPSEVSGPSETRHGLDVRNAIRLNILRRIGSGEFLLGGRIPTEAQLAVAFKTSRSNAHIAIRRLEDEGLVRRQRGRGTYVIGSPVASAKDVARRPGGRIKRVHVIRGTARHETYQQIQQSMSDAGIHVECIDVDDEHVPPSVSVIESLVARLTSEGSQALIILANLLDRLTPTEDPRTLEPYVAALMDYPGRVCWYNWPGVALNRWPYDAVSLAPFSEGVSMGRYLAQNAVSRVIWFGRSHIGWAHMRADGLAMALNRVPHRTDLSWHWYESREDIPAMIDAALDEVDACKEPPTLMMSSDAYTEMILNRAAARGMNCPGSFYLVGFDNGPLAVTHKITSIAPPTERIAKEIVGMFTASGQARVGTAHNLKLKSVVVERASFVSNQKM